MQGPILPAEALQRIHPVRAKTNLSCVPISMQNLSPLPFIFLPMSNTWHPSGGCPEDCYIPYVMCPIPSGSLSMCGGTPRGQCMTSSGQCSCNTGYSGVDCGSCALGYSREGVRCVLEGEGQSGSALLAMPFLTKALLAMPFWTLSFTLGLPVLLTWLLQSGTQLCCVTSVTSSGSFPSPP